MKTIREAFSYTTAVQGTHWNPAKNQPPFKAISGDGVHGDLTSRIQRHEELISKAENILPFPLDRVVEPMAEAYIQMVQAKELMIQSSKSNLLPASGRRMLRANIKKIQSMMDGLKMVSGDIEKMKFGFGS